MGKYERNDNMDQELLKFAISQWLFAAIFVQLLINTREESLNKTNVDNNGQYTMFNLI